MPQARGAAGAGAALSFGAVTFDFRLVSRDICAFSVSTTTAFSGRGCSAHGALLDARPLHGQRLLRVNAQRLVVVRFIAHYVRFRGSGSFTELYPIATGSCWINPVIRLTRIRIRGLLPLQSCALIQVRCAFTAMAMQHKRPLYEPPPPFPFKYGCMYSTFPPPNAKSISSPVKRVKEGTSGPSRCTTARRA